jgi:hypothetical protein
MSEAADYDGAWKEALGLYLQPFLEYYHRIVDRYRRRVVTLVVLADPRPGWRPGPYEEELWGCRVRFEYPVCKLLELGRDQEALEQSDNPAATVVAAHLAAQATDGDMELRKVLKGQLARRLYERGYGEKEILELLRLIDWLLVLPEGLEIAFREELTTFEREKTTPHITSFERLSREEGLQQGMQRGRQEAILDLLGLRFGDVPVPVVERVKALQEEVVLRRLLREAALLPSLEAFVAQLPN